MHDSFYSISFPRFTVFGTTKLFAVKCFSAACKNVEKWFSALGLIFFFHLDVENVASVGTWKDGDLNSCGLAASG